MSLDSVNILFLSFCIALVFIMQAGFLCLEAGAVRSKNTINVASKNLLDFIIVTLAYVAIGFYIQYGSFYTLLENSHKNAEGGLYLFLLFQTLFAATAATLVSGAVAERCGLKGYLIISLLIATFIYPVAGQWIWGGTLDTRAGWLAQMGFIDFAGSTVVHSLGGSVALAALLIIGPRKGVYEQENGFRGQNIVLSLLGVLFLWLGWFGFNMGSLLKLGPQAPVILINTFVAAAAGGLAAMVWSHFSDKKVKLLTVANGILAGLVGITASAHAMIPETAILIGFVSGLLCCFAMVLMDYYKLDDVIGAVPVHLVAGLWGTIAVALLGNPEILDTGNDYMTQLGIQVFGCLMVIFWSFCTSYILLRIINHFIPLRVPEKSELIGLNIAEHGAVSELAQLVGQLEKQSTTEQFKRLGTDPFSELYPIAQQYNLILGRFLQSQSAMQQNIATLEELRDQLQSQRDIAEAANQHKTEFLAKMSHEIRTPLNGIIGLAELLNDETLNSEQKEYIAIILQSGQSLLAIINDILDFSKIEAGKLTLDQQPYDLERLLEQCIAAFTAETLKKPIELKLDIQSKNMPSQFKGDSGRIRQIIMNLLGNAFKFTEQGQIKLSVAYDEAQELLTVTVSDTGKGIAAHKLKYIFQSFEQEDNSTQRKFGGSGLGLAISRQLVALMDGDIWVESTLGEGSCFYFRINCPAISPDIS